MIQIGDMSHTRIVSGLRTVGAWLLGMAWLFVVFAGMGISFSASRYRPFVGWILLAAAAVVFVATATRWIKALPALVGFATLNSLATVVTGHLTNQPSVSISRIEAMLATLLLGTGAALSVSFTKRALNVLDRIVLLIFVLCIVWGATEPPFTLVALGVGVCCLFLAWAYEHSFRRKAQSVS